MGDPPPFVSFWRAGGVVFFFFFFTFESNRKHRTINRGDLFVLFGDVLHHICLSSSTHTHPFEEREKTTLKNESKEVTAKSAKAPVLCSVRHRKLPVHTDMAYRTSFRLFAWNS